MREHGNLILLPGYAGSSTALRSPLSEGAFGTKTVCADFLFVFCLSAKPTWNPATKAGFSFYKKKPDRLAQPIFDGLVQCPTGFSFRRKRSGFAIQSVGRKNLFV